MVSQLPALKPPMSVGNRQFGVTVNVLMTKCRRHHIDGVVLSSGRRSHGSLTTALVGDGVNR